MVLENEDDFLEAGVEVAETFDLGEVVGVVGVGDEDPEALVTDVWRGRNRACGMNTVLLGHAQGRSAKPMVRGGGIHAVAICVTLLLVPFRRIICVATASVGHAAASEALGGGAGAGFAFAAGGGGELLAGGLVIVKFFVSDEVNSFGDNFDFGGRVAILISSVDSAGYFDDFVLFEFGADLFVEIGENDDFLLGEFVLELDEGHAGVRFGENSANIADNATDGDDFVVVF